MLLSCPPSSPPSHSLFAKKLFHWLPSFSIHCKFVSSCCLHSLCFNDCSSFRVQKSLKSKRQMSKTRLSGKRKKRNQIHKVGTSLFSLPYFSLLSIPSFWFSSGWLFQPPWLDHSTFLLSWFQLKLILHFLTSLSFQFHREKGERREASFSPRRIGRNQTITSWSPHHSSACRTWTW